MATNIELNPDTLPIQEINHLGTKLLNAERLHTVLNNMTPVDTWLNKNIIQYGFIEKKILYKEKELKVPSIA